MSRRFGGLKISEEEEVIKVLLADDHALFRKGLRQLLDGVGDMQVVGEAADGNEVLAALQTLEFDIILLDVSMPGIAGAELILKIRATHPDLAILVLTMHDTPQFVKNKLQAGANGYLTKDCDPDILCQAIRKIVQGGRFIAPEMAELLAFDAGSGSMRLPHERLTERETQIFMLLVRGMSINNIAHQLSISDKTVSTHKARLMKKMGIETNAQLVSYGLKSGFTM